MKRTKSMIYNQTQESIELTHFAANTKLIYPQIQNTVRNLAKKYAKGVYNAEKAIDAFYYIACAASDLYKINPDLHTVFKILIKTGIFSAYIDDLESSIYQIRAIQ